MAITVTHTTAADATFSAAGKAAWEEGHTVSGVQETLVSGTNIKTINNTSLLGSGDITITSGGVQSVVQGSNVVVDNTDPANPVISIGDYIPVDTRFYVSEGDTVIIGNNGIQDAHKLYVVGGGGLTQNYVLYINCTNLTGGMPTYIINQSDTFDVILTPSDAAGNPDTGSFVNGLPSLTIPPGDWIEVIQNAAYSGVRVVSASDAALVYTTKVVAATVVDNSITEAKLSLSDVTTWNVSNTTHGFVPKGLNDTTKFLRSDGTWANLSSGASVLINQTAVPNMAQNAETNITAMSVVGCSELYNDTNATMTSMTAPTGYVVGESGHYGGYDAHFAFDGVILDTNAWTVIAGTVWLTYKFPSSVLIKEYRLYSSGANNNRCPKNWTFYGSNTGTFTGEETLLDTQSNQSFIGAETKTYLINTTTPYQYYKLLVTANNGDGSYTWIEEMKIVLQDKYRLLQPATDYSVAKSNSTGSQTLTVKRLKASTATTIIDYL